MSQRLNKEIEYSDLCRNNGMLNELFLMVNKRIRYIRAY